MRRGRIALVLLAAALIAGWLARAPIGMALFERAVESRAGRDATADLSDGLHVALCGTGSPLPSAERAGACTLVIAGKRLFVVDAGEGGARTLQLMGMPLARVERLLLTHFHSDHIDGLGPLMLMRWTGAAATTPLPVHGPAGVEQVISGFNQAYAQDNRYRTAHHGAQLVPPTGGGAQAMPFVLEGDSTVILNEGGVRITAFRVNHNPVDPAVGYRFDYGGRSVVLSGDTAANVPALATAAKGVDILVHEALQPKMVAAMTRALDARGVRNTAQITRDILTYHATPAGAARLAQSAGVRHLVLSHIVPPTPSRLFDAAFLDGADALFNGELTVGRDGMIFSLPAQQQSKP